MKTSNKRYVQVCKMIIRGQPFYKKVKFSKRLLKIREWNEKDLESFLDFICFEDVQKRERHKTNDELLEIYVKLEKIGKHITTAQENRENARFIKYEKEILYYDDYCKMFDEMEQKHNDFLSRR